MSYHEAFWLAAGAAAPVIALAAVVARPEIGVTEFRFWEQILVEEYQSPDRDQFYRSANRRTWKWVKAAEILTMSNVVIQAGLLAVSLASLAAGRNIIPPWVAIVLATGGIVILSWAVSKSASVRSMMAHIDPRAYAAVRARMYPDEGLGAKKADDD